MFLLYLYTLELPDFSRFGKHSHSLAFDAIVLGDQYLVDALSAAGQAFLVDRYRAPNFIKVWETGNETRRTNRIVWIRRFFDAEQAGFKAVRAVAIDSLARLKDEMMEREDFREFLFENQTFATEFVKTLPNKS